MSDKYDLAINLFEKGYKIIATFSNKTPIQKGWNKDNYIKTYDEIEYYYKQNSCFEIAIRCDDLVIIDIDEHEQDKSGNEEFKKFCKKYDINEINTFYQKSKKNNGKHIFFKYSNSKIKIAKIADNIDILTSSGRYCMISTYKAEFGDFDDITDLNVELENAILSEQKSRKKKSAIRSSTLKKNNSHDDILKIKEGNRNNYLFNNALKFLNQFNFNTSLNLIQTLNTSACEPNLSFDEVTRIVKSAKKYQEDSFYTLDRNILKNKNLKGNDKCVYFYIKERYIENDYRPVLISQQDFLNDLNLSETTLKKAKRNLAKSNYIKTERTRKKDVWGYSKYYINI